MKKFGNYRRIVQVSESETDDDDDFVTSSPTLESSIRTNTIGRSRIFNLTRNVPESPKRNDNVSEHVSSSVIDDSDFLDASDDNDIFNSTKSSNSENNASDNEICEQTVQNNSKDSLIVSNKNVSCDETDFVNTITDSDDCELTESSNLKDSLNVESSNNASCDVIDLSSDSTEDYEDAKSEPVVCAPALVQTTRTSVQKDNDVKNIVASPEDSEKNVEKNTGENVALTLKIADGAEGRRSTYFSAFDLDVLRKSLPCVAKQRDSGHHQQKNVVSVKKENTDIEDKTVPESEGNVSCEILSPLTTKWQGSVLEKKSEDTKATLVRQVAIRQNLCEEGTNAVNESGSVLSVKSEDTVLKKIETPEAAVIKQEELVTKGNSGSPEIRIPEGIKSPQTLRSQITALQSSIQKTKGILMSANIATLPDRGVRLQMTIAKDENELKKLRNDLQISEEWHAKNGKAAVISAKDKIKQEWGKQHHDVRPLEQKNFNSMTGTKVSEYEVSGRLLTVDALEQLHKSLETRPADNIFEEDPKGLKSNFELMAHQKHALAWLRWRERQKPRGGILADDMGLGKTLTMISLILKSLEEDEDERDNSDSENSDDSQKEEDWLQSRPKKWENGGTLVVCPASLVNQWESEIKSKCKSDILKVVVHHGPSREKSARKLSKFDVVITTYSIVRNEAGFINARDSDICDSKKGALHNIRWHRIILDEGHTIRNHKNKTSVAVIELRGRHRWVLTGTPLHNKELDVYALLKFLRCTPFDEISVWRRWVDNKNASGLHRLNAIMNAIMLRRTKDQLLNSGSLQCLPEKNIHIIPVKLSEEEFLVYETLLNYSKTLFAQFLHQRAEKEEQNSKGSLLPFLHTTSGKHSVLNNGNNTGISKELASMYNHMNNIQDVKTFQILVLLLRLRQLCCHPGLIKAMLDEEAKAVDGIEDDSGIDQDVLTKLSNLSLTESNNEDATTSSDNKETEKKVLVESNPVFDLQRCSSKMQAVFDTLTETVLSSGDKAVIISQWTSMLEIIAKHLQQMGVRYTMLNGSVPVKERGYIVDKFNRPDRGPKVMLLSLTAGGVGLNLVGANHLFLFDVHWNPQLEAQACDRVYRVGQKKPVHIYKFFCEETIEARIKKMQDSKLALASEVLTGAKQKRKDKLSLDDLRVLFGF